VTYSATVTDNLSGVSSLTYSKASGTFFTMGDTTVTVTATDVAGNVSTANFTVTVWVPIITTVVGNGNMGCSGDGGPPTSASLGYPGGVVVSPISGDLYIADTGNHCIRKVSADTDAVTTVAGIAGYPDYWGDGYLATDAALHSPEAVALDSAGNLYIADSGNNRVRKVDAGTGVISTVAGNGAWGFSGDGGPAVDASMYDPCALALDSAGNLFISDLCNQRVRKVDAATGIISTVAGNGQATELYNPRGLAFDSAGVLYIADSVNNRIRKLDEGSISTLPVSVTAPSGLAFDAAGNLYIAEVSNNRVRKVDQNGTSTAFAGNGTAGFSGDNGPPLLASLDSPMSLTVSSNGNVYIVDMQNNRIRRVGRDERPAAPSGLQVAPSEFTPVCLTWNDNATNAKWFKVERKTGETGAYSEIGWVPAGTTSYPDTDVQPAVLYGYRVRSTNLAGDSAPCAELLVVVGPTVAEAAQANPNPVGGTSTNLSVLGADSCYGESALIYFWEAIGSPPANVDFSANGTNGAKSAAATFSQAGTYYLQVTILDPGFMWTTSSVEVVVAQTDSGMAVVPASAYVDVGNTVQFAAEVDQFGNAMPGQPTFTWTVDGGGTITSNGNFIATALGGPHTVTATAASQQQATGSVTVVADTTAPRVSFFSPQVTSNGNPTLCAHITDTASGVNWASLVATMVTSSGNGVAITTAILSEGGTNTGIAITPDASLAEGQYTVNVWAWDNASTPNEGHESWSFIVDKTGPLITCFSPASGSTLYDTAWWPIIEAEVLDTGSGVDWASVTMKLDNGTAGPPDVVEPPYIFMLPSNLTVASHTVTVYGKDLAGNQAVPASTTFTYAEDLVGPTITVVSPMDGSAVNTRTPTIQVAISQAVSGVDWSTLQVYVDGIQVVPSTPTPPTGFTYSPSSMLELGDHTVSVYVCSVSGIFGEAGWQFTVADPGPITISSLTPADGSTVYNDPLPDISAQVSDWAGNWSIVSVIVTVTSNGNPVSLIAGVSGFPYKPSAGLAPGQYTAAVSIDDDASPSNTAQKSWSFTILQDKKGPTITWLNPAEGAEIYDSDLPDIYAYFSDDLSGVDPNSVKFYIDDQDPKDFWASGQCAEAFLACPLSAGTHRVAVTLADIAGNITSNANFFNVVPTPTLQVVIYTNYGPLPQVWSAEVYLHTMYQAWKDVTSDCNIAWDGAPLAGVGPSYIIPAGTPEGGYTITATATYGLPAGGASSRSLMASARSLGNGLGLTASASLGVAIQAGPGGGDPRAAPPSTQPPDPPPGPPTAQSGGEPPVAIGPSGLRFEDPPPPKVSGARLETLWKADSLSPGDLFVFKAKIKSVSAGYGKAKIAAWFGKAAQDQLGVNFKNQADRGSPFEVRDGQGAVVPPAYPGDGKAIPFFKEPSVPGNDNLSKGWGGDPIPLVPVDVGLIALYTTVHERFVRSLVGGPLNATKFGTRYSFDQIRKLKNGTYHLRLPWTAVIVDVEDGNKVVHVKHGVVSLKMDLSDTARKGTLHDLMSQGDLSHLPLEEK